MGHVLFAAPSIRRYHVHERLARALRGRGHRIGVLCTDPVELTFHAAQGMPAWRIRPGPPWDIEAPVREFAVDHCRLYGLGARSVEAVERHLARLVGPALHWLEMDSPDLVLLHQERSGVHRLLHFLAQELGCSVLWTGDGLLPHTMQWDRAGLDGDSSVCRQRLSDFAEVEEEDLLLAAALAALIGRTEPVPLARRMLAAPPLAARLRDCLLGTMVGGRRSLLACLRAWRSAEPPRLDPPRDNDLPRQPFVALLLQRPSDPRLRLDVGNPPDALAFADAVRQAAALVEPEMPVVTVIPKGGLPPAIMGRLRRLRGVRLEPHTAGPEAAATAAACVSINHPLGIGALLAGTPVLHLGRTPYGLEGVAVRTSLQALTVDLPAAMTEEREGSARRFLSWLLASGHVWCDPDYPDQNGITGLVQGIESRMTNDGTQDQELRYRPGPAWPLATG